MHGNGIRGPVSDGVTYGLQDNGQQLLLLPYGILARVALDCDCHAYSTRDLRCVKLNRLPKRKIVQLTTQRRGEFPHLVNGNP